MLRQILKQADVVCGDFLKPRGFFLADDFLGRLAFGLLLFRHDIGSEYSEAGQVFLHGVVVERNLSTICRDHFVSKNSIAFSDVGNLDGERFATDPRGQQFGHEMLHRQAEETTQPDDKKEAHQNLFEQSAEAETGMKQNEWEAERAEPDVSSKPELSTAQSPERKLFAASEQPGVNHHERADDAIDQPHEAAAAGAFGSRLRIDHVRNRRHCHDGRGDQCPRAMCPVKQHCETSCRSIEVGPASALINANIYQRKIISRCARKRIPAS